MVCRFRSFGDDVHAQVLRQIKDGLDNAVSFRLSLKGVDERAVNLERIERKLMQVAQRRITCPELVDADTHTNTRSL